MSSNSTNAISSDSSDLTDNEVDEATGMNDTSSHQRRKASTHQHTKSRDYASSSNGRAGASTVSAAAQYTDNTHGQLEMERLASRDGAISSDEDDDEEVGLTKKHKHARRKRRRSSLGHRIGSSSGNIRDQESEPVTGKSQADRKIIRALFINAVLVMLWYLFSLSISIYNKWMFSEKYLNFRFPLFTTCFHMLVQFCLASLVLYLVPRLRPVSDRTMPPGVEAPKASWTSLMTRNFYLTRIGPCGAATGLDIGLGNMSLKFITLTFYTMCKSSSLAFVLTFAFLFRLESPSMKLIAIIVTMTIGVVMMVAGEVEFNALGFTLVILAAFFSGFRWSLTQILLLRSPATSNPFSSIFYLAPVMFISLFVIAAPVEGFAPLKNGIHALMIQKGPIMAIGILTFPGIIAFLMTASEFALLQRTSVVTLSICGIFKEVVTIAAAGIAFGDPLTPINISGLCVTIASIAAYNFVKITKMRAEAREAEGVADGSTEAMLSDHDRVK